MARLKPLDPDQFYRDIMEQIRQSTRKVIYEVGASEAQRYMIETVQKEIYNEYHPVKYVRRRSDKGLIDPKNIKVLVHRQHLSFEEGHRPKGDTVLVMTNTAKRTQIIASENPNGRRSRRLYKTAKKVGEKTVISDPEEDLLYYWKDEGYIYDLWNSDSYPIYGRSVDGSRPRHMNQKIDTKMYRSVSRGAIGSALLKEYKRHFKVKFLGAHRDKNEEADKK